MRGGPRARVSGCNHAHTWRTHAAIMAAILGCGPPPLLQLAASTRKPSRRSLAVNPSVHEPVQAAKILGVQSRPAHVADLPSPSAVSHIAPLVLKTFDGTRTPRRSNRFKRDIRFREAIDRILCLQLLDLSVSDIQADQSCSSVTTTLTLPICSILTIFNRTSHFWTSIGLVVQTQAKWQTSLSLHIHPRMRGCSRKCTRISLTRASSGATSFLTRHTSSDWLPC